MSLMVTHMGEEERAKIGVARMKASVESEKAWLACARVHAVKSHKVQ